MYEVVNAGVSGDTSAGGLSRLDWSLEGDVRILVIELGANDGLRGLPVAALKRNLTEIITRARARGITVVLTGMEAPPNFGAAYTNEFRQVYRDLANAHDVTFIPFYLDGVAGIPSLNIADGMHPNAEGSRLIAGTLWRTLEPLLEKSAGEVRCSSSRTDCERRSERDEMIELRGVSKTVQSGDHPLTILHPLDYTIPVRSIRRRGRAVGEREVHAPRTAGRPRRAQHR